MLVSATSREDDQKTPPRVDRRSASRLADWGSVNPGQSLLPTFARQCLLGLFFVLATCHTFAQQRASTESSVEVVRVVVVVYALRFLLCVAVAVWHAFANSAGARNAR